MKNINSLKNRIFGGKEDSNLGEAAGVVRAMRELGSVGDFLGREFDVFDKKGKLVYTVKQRSVTLVQLKILNKQIDALIKHEEKKMKEGSKKPKGRNR